MKLVKQLGVTAALALGSSCCVAKGTLVRTPRGERRVEELQVGDEVTCVDPASGAQHVARISQVRTSRRECVALEAAGARLVCTSDHPVYDPATGTYADAGDWVLARRRQVLCVASEGAKAVVEVQDRSFDAGVHQVFDLTVDHPLHNFVADGVLVHNKTPPCGPADPTTYCANRVECPTRSVLVTVCTSQWGSPECRCQLADGGFTPPFDAGASDAGATDAGADAGP